MRAILTSSIVAAALTIAIIATEMRLAFGRRAPDTLEQVRARRSIRIGYSVEAPYAYLTEDGIPTGEAPVLAGEVARRMGIDRVEWRLTEFGLLIDGLESGQFDVIAAGMFVTPERERRILFSTPTFRVREGLLVRRDERRPLPNIGALLARSDVRVAALSGSVEERLLLSRGLEPMRLVRVPESETGSALIAAGGADVLMLSRPALRHMAATSRDRLAVVEDFDDGAEPSAGAFGFRRSDEPLRAAWNEALARLLGTPEHRALVERFDLLASEIAP